MSVRQLLDLSGRVALITGGSTGIGRGIALALAQEGVHIAVASRNPEARVAEEIEAYGVRCLLLKVDVSQEDQVMPHKMRLCRNARGELARDSRRGAYEPRG